MSTHFLKENKKSNEINDLKNKNFEIYTLFGNNFEKKICRVEISQNNYKFTYTDKHLITKKNKKNYQKCSPLENSVNHFINSCNRKLFFNS